MKKRTTAALFVALLLGTGGLAYGVGRATDQLSGHDPRLANAHTSATPMATPTPPPSPASPASPASSPPYTALVTRSPVASPTRTARPPSGGARLLGPDDDGPHVRALQARLRQIFWYAGDVTDHYGPRTTTAVRGFQEKRGIPVTGYVDRRTRLRLAGMTHSPTSAELQNQVTPMGNTPGRLDPRCRTGRVVCIDKTSRTLRWVVDGTVRRTVDVRFGASYAPTREGVFHIYWKDATHVSRLYGSAMPYSMFFSKGQAVHYSSDFAARGYAGASHGCVNVRDHAGVKWLFDHTRVGDAVVIYWS